MNTKRLMELAGVDTSNMLTEMDDNGDGAMYGEMKGCMEKLMKYCKDKEGAGYSSIHSKASALKDAMDKQMNSKSEDSDDDKKSDSDDSDNSDSGDSDSE